MDLWFRSFEKASIELGTAHSRSILHGLTRIGAQAPERQHKSTINGIRADAGRF